VKRANYEPLWYGYAIFYPSVSIQIIDHGTFYGKGPNPLLWAGSRAARAKIISGIPNCLNYCEACIVCTQLQMWLQTAGWRAMAQTVIFSVLFVDNAQSRRKPVNLPKETKFCTHTQKMWNCDDHHWSTKHNETSVGRLLSYKTYNTTSRRVPEDSNLYSPHHENLPYYRFCCVLLW
jgi:hypothetical protein